MLPQLTPDQCRVIGVMLEKEVTTPDQYPLSLNGLTTGCNQKSNREPVMSLSEGDVQNLLDELTEKKLVADEGAFSSRVAKYRHRFCNTEFGSFKLSEQEKAIVCVMLLRGPQTPGELRTRTNRLAEFANVNEVEAVLATMSDNQIVVKLEREPGKRESRYAHLFCGGVQAAAPTTSETKVASGSSQETRISELEQRVEALEKLVEELIAGS